LFERYRYADPAVLYFILVSADPIGVVTVSSNCTAFKTRRVRVDSLDLEPCRIDGDEVVLANVLSVDYVSTLRPLAMVGRRPAAGPPVVLSTEPINGAVAVRMGVAGINQSITYRARQLSRTTLRHPDPVSAGEVSRVAVLTVPFPFGRPSTVWLTVTSGDDGDGADSPTAAAAAVQSMGALFEFDPYQLIAETAIAYGVTVGCIDASAAIERRARWRLSATHEHAAVVVSGSSRANHSLIEFLVNDWFLIRALVAPRHALYARYYPHVTLGMMARSRNGAAPVPIPNDDAADTLLYKFNTVKASVAAWLLRRSNWHGTIRPFRVFYDFLHCPDSYTLATQTIDVRITSDGGALLDLRDCRTFDATVFAAVDRYRAELARYFKASRCGVRLLPPEVWTSANGVYQLHVTPSAHPGASSGRNDRIKQLRDFQRRVRTDRTIGVYWYGADYRGNVYTKPARVAIVNGDTVTTGALAVCSIVPLYPHLAGFNRIFRPDTILGEQTDGNYVARYFDHAYRI